MNHRLSTRGPKSTVMLRWDDRRTRQTLSLRSTQRHGSVWWTVGLRLCLILVCSWAAVSVVSAQQAAPADRAPDQQTSAESDDERDWRKGWLQLFDRETVFGWRGVNPSSVRDGKLIIEPADGMPRTSSQFADFQMSVRYRLSAGGEAELRLRTNPRGTQVGRDYLRVELEHGEHEMTIHCEGQKLSSWAADQTDIIETVETINPLKPDSLPRIGYVGIRVNKGSLELLNLQIRPIGQEPVRYQSGSPEHWDQSGLGAAEVTEFEGYSRLAGGPGYLASRQQFDDFILRIQARTPADVNSGVFFRCIPGESLNGYESQIHNGFLEGDRHRPSDCGTGGIFRRVDARRIVATDDEWFEKVIVACGGQISVWVNGIQVTDWSDQRAPHPNPRRGRRLEAGPIMLQAHDPGTILDFKHLSVISLPQR